VAPTPKNRDEVLPLIAEHRLKKMAKEILAAARPSIRLVAAKGTGERALRFSRLGGLPLLPRSLAWPRHRRRPLTFIAQIQLSELQGFEIPPECPKQGRLYFFCDVRELPPSGDDIDDVGRWRVLFHPDEKEPVAEAPAPQKLEPHEVLRKMPLILRQAMSIPPTRSVELTRLPEMDDKTRGRYFDLHYALWPEGPHHRLFGHPLSIQGCMQRTAQFVSQGEVLPEGVYSWYEHSRAAELMPGAHDWILLLQIDSDESLSKYYWGDAGTLYYWIKRKDLAAGRFDRVWFFMQCG